MLIYFSNMQNLEGIRLPSLFQIGSYKVFFWSDENNEPIHIHIATGKPSANATKILITSSGGCIVANNNSRIPSKDLNELLEIISAQFFMICKAWREHFVVDDIKFYC